LHDEAGLAHSASALLLEVSIALLRSTVAFSKARLASLIACAMPSDALALVCWISGLLPWLY